MSDAESLRAAIPQMMAKARSALLQAQLMLADEQWDAAANRAYYAVFRAMTAVLASSGQAYAKHSGVIAFFRQQFIKTGIFPAEFSEVIEGLSENRTVGDYSFQLDVDPEDVTEGLAAAERFVNAVTVYLDDQNTPGETLS
jgi:uncharacterized protein (UPF0332 family)